MSESPDKQKSARPGPDSLESGDPRGFSVDQLLIAYLDGELDDPAAAELESRLASDAELRKRLHEFQQTWDMLDEVHRSTADNKFVRSTLEMVVTTAEQKRTRWHRWPLRIAIGGAAFGLAAWLAVQGVRYFQQQPYRQFVAELEFWENADLYDKVDSMEFVEQLHDSGLFAGELSDEP